MASKPLYYTVTDSLIGTLDGATVEYHKGEIVDAEDPAVRKWPHHFGPLVIRGHGAPAPIEQATAAPGETREVGRAMSVGAMKGRA